MLNRIKMTKHNNIILLELIAPENLNALTLEMIRELENAIKQIEQDTDISVVIITGSGKAFVSGADISHMKELKPLEAAEYSTITTNVFKSFEDSKKIFIAAVNGYALGGGCELILYCDFRIASRNAKIGLPETSLGIIPGAGGTQKLSRLIGLAKAKEMILLGEIIDADNAMNIGLVNYVVDGDRLIDKVYEFAYRIQKNSPVALGYAKEAIVRGIDLDTNSGLNLEKNLFSLCFSNHDQLEGMSAFIEKRKPKFSTVKQI